MTRTPPEKPPPSGHDDRFVPIEEVDVPQAEVLGEYPADGPVPLEAHFLVIREYEEEPPDMEFSRKPALERAMSPSAAVLRSRRRVIRRTKEERSPRHAHVFLPVPAQVGPPLPLLLIAVFVLLALAL